MKTIALILLLISSCAEEHLPSPAPHGDSQPPFRYMDCGAFTQDGRHCLEECEKIGCIDLDCPAGGKDGSCEVDVLVECHGELVHGGCVQAFEQATDNADGAR